MNFCPGPTPKVDEISEKILILNRKTDGEPERPFYAPLSPGPSKVFNLTISSTGLR